MRIHFPSRLRLGAILLALVAIAVAPAAARAQMPGELLVVWTLPDGSELERRTLSLDEIEAIEPAGIVTTTPWNERAVRFDGALFAALAESGPRPATEARLVALNDYSITVPAEDWRNWPIVLASRSDGTRMRVRDKGPLWLVYPLDEHPELRRQMYMARKIWQVRAVTFVVEPE